jgi:hypothetical protein
MGKQSKKALELFHHLFRQPVVTVNDVQMISGLSPRASNDLVQAFMDHAILVEKTGYRRNRVLLFQEYMGMF